MQRRTSNYIRIHTYTIAYIGIQGKHMITYDRRDIEKTKEENQAEYSSTRLTI